eukprot:3695902-Amphidinium_carterae.1
MYGADCNAGDYDARTALHVACASGNKPAVELLLEQDAAALRLSQGKVGKILEALLVSPAITKLTNSRRMPLVLSQC